MGYVVAGYVFVLGTLFLYAAHLVWRRQRLDRAVARVLAHTADPADPRPVGQRDGPAAPAAGR